jgi:inorganic pyrophosphatase
MLNKYTLHPWHGIDLHEQSPELINAFIEIVPSDTVKYEIDKKSGFLKIDRPQKFSNIIPALYGFIPQTYCGENIAEYAMYKTTKKNIRGDGDPLDICVLTEKIIPHGYLLVQAIPIGGFRMFDGNQADDKIIAVLKDDAVYGNMNNISNCPALLIERIKHYFLTYKQMPGSEIKPVEITHTYDSEEAKEVILKSINDYKEYIKNA